jgi:hypothetical protein
LVEDGAVVCPADGVDGGFGCRVPEGLGVLFEHPACEVQAITLIGVHP